MLTELNLTVPKARPEPHTFDFIGFTVYRSGRVLDLVVKWYNITVVSWIVTCSTPVGGWLVGFRV